ncbi:MAG: copper oxidase [Methylococcales bacterium]|nr:copper oxidase [Methylococcales bacterium]
MTKLLSVGVLTFILFSPVSAKEFQDHNTLMDHGDGHMMDMDGGMIMGNNTETLPGGCTKIAATEEITVHAGHKYSEKFPGRMFAFDQQEYHFKPCTKLTINFVNDDEIRHQWMMHGLPKYLYPKGMFHLELTGPGKISGTLILPSTDKTYLVHCDIAQHMEKGMKAQLIVGKGSGTLPSIPGISAYVIQDDYSDSIPVLPTAEEKALANKKNNPAATQVNNAVVSGVTIIGLAIGLLLTPFLVKRFKGKTFSQSIAYTFEIIAGVLNFLVKGLKSIMSVFSKTKTLPKK